MLRGNAWAGFVFTWEFTLSQGSEGKPIPRPPAEELPPAASGDQEHEGATEDEVTPTTPPSGPEFEDEPKQG